MEPARGGAQVLYTFEQPKYIYLEPREWIANGAIEDTPTGIPLLTETFKMKREVAKTHYYDVIKVRCSFLLFALPALWCAHLFFFSSI